MVLGKRLPAVALFLIPSPPLPLRLIITYHFFTVFCNMLQASKEKAWIKSGALRTVALLKRGASHIEPGNQEIYGMQSILTKV